MDALGNPLRLRLTAGQRHDITQAEALIEGLPFEVLIADTSYDAADFIASIERQEAQAVIPSRKNRTELRDYDVHLYRERHLIECFIHLDQAVPAGVLTFREAVKELSRFSEFRQRPDLVTLKCQHNLVLCNRDS